jgi:O-antigen/teichoic acid export membrane protein
MLKHLKQLASDSLIYGLSGVIAKMIGIFLIPLYTRLFLPEDYGIINLINTSFFLIGLLVVCGLDSAVGRWFYDSQEEEDQKKTFAAYIWFQIVIAIIFCCVIIISSLWISKFFFKDTRQSIYFVLPAISLVTNILPSVLINWYRLHRRPVATVIFTIAHTLTTIGLTVLFVIVFHWHITGVFAAITVSSTIYSIVVIFQLKNWLHFSWFTTKRLRVMLNFAIPMIPAAISYWLLNNTDSYFIAYFTKSTHEVGLFGIGAMVASGLGLFTGAFQQAWGPFAFSIINDAEAKKIYANVFLLYGYVIGLLAALLMLYAPEILMTFTTSDYYDSAWVAGILGYNLLFIGLSYIAIIGTTIVKSTRPYGYAMLYATILTILLNVILIPRFGKEGSALATVIAQVLVPVYLFYIGQKVYPIPYKFAHVAVVIITLLAIVVAVRFMTFDNLITQVLVKVVVTFSLIAATFFLNRGRIILLIEKFRKNKVTTEH